MAKPKEAFDLAKTVADYLARESVAKSLQKSQLIKVLANLKARILTQSTLVATLRGDVTAWRVKSEALSSESEDLRRQIEEMLRDRNAADARWRALKEEHREERRLLKEKIEAYLKEIQRLEEVSEIRRPTLLLVLWE